MAFRSAFGVMMMELRTLIFSGILGLLPFTAFGANEPGGGGGTTMIKRPRLKVLAGTEQKQPVRLLSALGVVQAEATAIRLDIELPSGKKSSSNIIVGLEPKTGLAWWSLAPGPEYSKEPLNVYLRTHVIFLAREEIVTFHITGGRSLLIEQFKTRPKNIQESVNSILPLIEEELATANSLRSGRHLVKLREFLGNDFPYLKFASVARGTEITDVRQSGIYWAVFLRGPNKDSATVKFDHNFNFVSATINGTPAMMKSAE